jgi:hypothetical protein
MRLEACWCGCPRPDRLRPRGAARAKNAAPLLPHATMNATASMTGVCALPVRGARRSGAQYLLCVCFLPGAVADAPARRACAPLLPCRRRRQGAARQSARRPRRALRHDRGRRQASRPNRLTQNPFSPGSQRCPRRAGAPARALPLPAGGARRRLAALPGCVYAGAPRRRVAILAGAARSRRGRSALLV